MSERKDKDTEQPAFINAKRRGFLQGAAVAGGVAASGVAVAETIDTPAIEPQPATDSGKGYQLTEHVKKYYQRARY